MILKKKMSTLSNLFLPDGLISHPFFDLFCPFHPPPTPKHISFSEVHVSWRLFFFFVAHITVSTSGHLFDSRFPQSCDSGVD